MNINEIPKAHPELLDALHRQDENARKMKLSEDFTEKVMEKVKSTQKKSSLFTLHSSLQKIAAIFIGILFISGIAFAVIHFVRNHSVELQVPQTEDTNTELANQEALTPVRFDDVRLDSILTVVSAHYGKSVLFRDEELRGMKFITTWNPADSLSAFIEHLNMFDYLHLTLQEDTIIVESISEEDEQ